MSATKCKRFCITLVSCGTIKKRCGPIHSDACSNTNVAGIYIPRTARIYNEKFNDENLLQSTSFPFTSIDLVG